MGGQKFFEMLKLLISKTRANEIEWELITNGTVQDWPDGYYVTVGEYTVGVPWDENNETLSLYDSEQQWLDDINANDLDELIGSDAPRFFDELQALARRSASGVTKAVDSIICELSD